MTAYHAKTARRPAAWGALVLLAGLALGAAGCGEVLDVENPNNVPGEALLEPAAMEPVTNGALYTVQEGYAYMLGVYATAANELNWIGSRDAWFQLELGTPNDPGNEFTDAAFRVFAPGRWMADEAIGILEAHAQSDVADIRAAAEANLPRAYLYGAISYVTIADWFDDFALSNRDTAGAPLGEAGMGQLYPTAIGYLDNALAIEGGEGSALERNLLAYRARARHSQGVWNLVGVRPIGTITDPLVSDAQMAADAAAALALDGSDWAYMFDYGASTVWSDVGWEVNERLELRFHGDYIIPTGDGTVRDTDAADRGVRLRDPIDGIGDPRLDLIMTEFEAGARYADLRVVSAREMYLILAEDALANGTETGANSFEQYINDLRAMDDTLSAWVSGGAGMPTAQDLLIHERRVNLYLQGRRLNDLYRFELQGSSWQPTRPAVTDPGTFLPITRVERDANCHLSQEFEC
jgi:hypothetical protein